MSRICRKQLGVTLIELLIVMAILVVIGGLGLPAVMRMADRSQLSSAARELQAELNRTRLESMKSGEPLVFRFQPGTGNYEIMAKQEYDLRFPPQRQPASSLPNMDMMDGASLSGATSVDPSSTSQAAGSTGPTFADYGSTSLADSVAGQSHSLSDAGEPSTFADLGPPSSLSDRFTQPDMQMIAAMPVSKFTPVQKFLPHNLIFDNIAFQPQIPNPQFPNPTPQLPAPNSTLSWSEPIFFFPNGRTSNAHFAVCSIDGKGYFIDVSVRGLTGTARLGDLEVLP